MEQAFGYTRGCGEGAVATTARGFRGLQTKICPRCGAELFADMPVCYGCLYDFSRQGRAAGGQPGIPDAASDLDEPVLPPASRACQEGRMPIGRAGCGDTDVLVGPHPACPGCGGRCGKHDGEDRGLVADAHACPWDEDDDEGGPGIDPYGYEECYGCEEECPGVDRCRILAPPRAAPAATARLWVRGSSVDVMTRVTPDGIVCGRDSACDVVLHSHAVSRQHVRLTPLPEGALVEDLGATNPAVLHGRPVQGAVRMSFGETLDVCGTMLTLVGPT